MLSQGLQKLQNLVSKKQKSTARNWKKSASTSCYDQQCFGFYSFTFILPIQCTLPFSNIHTQVQKCALFSLYIVTLHPVLFCLLEDEREVKAKMKLNLWHTSELLFYPNDYEKLALETTLSSYK